ncbi:PAS domain S-box-containing protein [Polymorphobacter multimanifer]|uniref:histidine kinase n=1 Tax=Polymorphobacter multimanifer TaxID=1070431 RepID=A0A841L3X2_9SPHN|nr:PAS domain-containing sensor histidine kinase [Polymorphobacter multimanifer]MBB6226141.1 PAS domain S-box-containing protein [Polymorphobacter multimanifer]
MAATDQSLARPEKHFLDGVGEMPTLFRNFDWSESPLGEPESWPPGLRAAVRIMLTTLHPVFIFWGPEHRCFYNDAYKALLSDVKHPAIFGRPAEEAWAEIWEDIGPQINFVFDGSGSIWQENRRLPILRSGGLKESWWTYSYGPIEDDTAENAVGGVFGICTERVAQLEVERRVSRELDRMRRLFDQGPGVMFVMRGPEHRFELANRACMQLLRHPGLIGRTAAEAIPEAADQGFIALLDSVYATGKPHVGHHHRLAFDRGHGEAPDEHYLNFVFAPVIDEAGKITGIFCQGTDVTESRRAAQATAEREAHFRNMANNAPVMIWVTEPDGRCTYLNRRWFEETGQIPANALGMGWLDATHPDDKPRVTAEFVQANAAERPFRTEYRLRLADGSYRWVLDSAGPRRGTNGIFLGYVGSVIDIDDRHEAERRIQTSENRFRAAVGAVQGIVWTNSAEGEMVDEQPGWQALTGQMPDEYAGYGWTAAVHPDDAAATVTAWRAAVDARRIFVHEHRVRRFDGEWRQYSVRAVPILDAEGGIIEWVGVHTDVTEQRAAEAALKALNDVLEARVQTEVTERLKVENALRQSQKMDALGQLTGGIAHDFNNMLSLITSAFSLLERKLSKDDPSVLQFIEVGQDAAMRAAGLTRRMLAFARQQPLSPARVEINALIENLRSLLAHSLGKGISIDCTLVTGIWPTIVDPNQLENAILNLAVNARDAMDGRGRLTIETSNATLAGAELSESVDAGDYVVICVTDNGKGMEPEVRARVFEPFFTTKPVGQGTGLGLSQVHGFVKQSGGGIEIASEPGRGTAVRLYLPRTTP